eukprot:CAMPEP_0113846446 /NCGR_PEP_ID=MMETSP0372-20130328/1312_1 /TAXON_ID=340204 /ORGANISM="Lankesteria abbotti" /LENGTH=248 /DNA_ID=CAMNT_0000815591 /DNA_START=649 /DNA_END=1395 /DNA_ORIENTATION=+ /assembly_acc=CAM_ASM_000359
MSGRRLEQLFSDHTANARLHEGVFVPTKPLFLNLHGQQTNQEKVSLPHTGVQIYDKHVKDYVPKACRIENDGVIRLPFEKYVPTILSVPPEIRPRRASLTPYPVRQHSAETFELLPSHAAYLTNRGRRYSLPAIGGGCLANNTGISGYTNKGSVEAQMDVVGGMRFLPLERGPFGVSTAAAVELNDSELCQHSRMMTRYHYISDSGMEKDIFVPHAPTPNKTNINHNKNNINHKKNNIHHSKNSINQQ